MTIPEYQQKKVERKLDTQKVKNYTVINEVKYLIPLSRRHPIYYLEYCKIIKFQQDVRILTTQNSDEIHFSLPIANIGALMLGPGCSITTEASRVITARGCLICFTGGGGSPLFLISSQHRSPLARIRQYKISFNEEERLKCAQILFDRRRKLIQEFSEFNLPEFPSGEGFQNLGNMMAAEAAWAKQAYRKCAKDFKIPWTTKEQEDESKENPITFLNFLSYSLSDIAIYHLGYDPNIGILHGRTKGGGLCYDLADIVKPILALIPSFVARKYKYSLGKMKEQFLSDVVRYDLLDYLIKTLELLFKELEQKEANLNARRF